MTDNGRGTDVTSCSGDFFVRYALFSFLSLSHKCLAFFIGLFVRLHTCPAPIEGDSMGKSKQQEHLRPPFGKILFNLFAAAAPFLLLCPKAASVGWASLSFLFPFVPSPPVGDWAGTDEKNQSYVTCPKFPNNQNFLELLSINITCLTLVQVLLLP